MKIFKFYFSVFLSFAMVSIMMTSCNDAPLSSVDKTSNSVNIAELLVRNEKLRMGKEWDEVQTNYQKLNLAIKKNANDQESKIKLAHLFIREARVTGEHGHYYNGALDLTNHIIKSPNVEANMQFLAMVTKAGVQLSHHEFDLALKTATAALPINNRNAQLYGVMVDALVEFGKYDEAVKMADIMIQIKPDLRAYARISYLREIHGDISGSIDAMKMALQAGVPGHEDTAWAMQTLADLYDLYGDTKKAKAMYEETLQLRPDYPFAIAALGKIYADDKQWEKAEEYTQRAIEIIPEVSFYTQLADLYKEQNKKSELLALVPTIFAMLEDDVEQGHNMNLEYAQVYLDIVNDKEKALDFTKKEYDKRPDNIDVNRMLAKIYLSKNDLQNTEKYLATAVSTNSGHPDIKKLRNFVQGCEI